MDNRMNDDAAYSEWAFYEDQGTITLFENNYESGEQAAYDWDLRYVDWSDECMYDEVPF